MKKRIVLSLCALLVMTGCAQKEETPAPAETVPAEPEKTAEATPESEKTPESTPTPEPEEQAVPGNYSDPAAFAGFDAYVMNILSGDYIPDGEVRIGETLLREHHTETPAKTRQYANDQHEAAKDPEMLEAGATGYFETRWLTKDGVPLSFTVYNPGDAPAAFADCVIIGTSNEEPVTFSNGVKLGGGHQETLDEIIAILGEPFQITGEEKEDSFNGQYLWRDESGDHILSMTVRIDGDHLEISMPVYMNYAVTKQ